ncbi:MAG: hypothetical protein GY854_08930 [Deltaproteobacteria bacterium]|nr:hypothetical protein [Deltaproteobacteria bacterium]
MNYELRCEGFPMDEELHDRLLLCGRKFVLEIGASHRVRMVVKQIDGLVQSRVELALPSRKISALVRRKDPIAAMKAAINALRDALDSEFSYAATGTA